MAKNLTIKTKEYKTRNDVIFSYKKGDFPEIPQEAFEPLYEHLALIAGMNIVLTVTVDDTGDGGGIHLKLKR